MPLVLLQGAITIGSRLKIEADFNVVTNYEVELTVQSGWHLGTLSLALDNVYLHVAYNNKVLLEAKIAATLTLSSLDFTLSATYNPNSQGWTFGGGSMPNETIQVGQFIRSLAAELGVSSHNRFLDAFTAISITTIYLEYTSSPNQSSQFALFLSLSAGSTFGNLPLDEILIRFQAKGDSVYWYFDAKAGQGHNVLSLPCFYSPNERLFE